METGIAETYDGSPPALGRRACDQCRLRKIRCDKETPCSNCRVARRSCSSTGAGQKPKEARQRVLISSQYERKIDQIEDRLSGIERLLQQLVSAQSASSVDTNKIPNVSQVGQMHETQSSRASVSSVDRTPSNSTGCRRGEVSVSEKGPDGDTSTNVFEVSEDAETFEGNSSLTAHTAFASEFCKPVLLMSLPSKFSSKRWTTLTTVRSQLKAEGDVLPPLLSEVRQHKEPVKLIYLFPILVADAVRKTTLRDGGAINPKFDAALNSLRQIIDIQNRSRQQSTGNVWSPAPSFTNPVSENASGEGSVQSRKHHARTNLKDLPLPPMTLVREQLSQLRHGPVPVMVAILYTFIDYEHFADRCRQLYFATEHISEASFIIVNVGLRYIFFEASLTASDPAKKARYEECCTMLQHNLEIALAQLEMMMPATGENIEALLMGASFSIDCSRASLAWILISRAAHMCRTLGYHQIQTMKDDLPQTKADKSLLFWCTYMLDKALSLRLGRASVLQDYDISLPHVMPDAKAAYPGKEVLTIWIQHARVLGRIYERLYSPGALRQPENMRTEQVKLLAAEQNHMMSETLALLNEFESATDGEGRMFALTLKSDEVSHFQSLTLTYRALPPNGPRSRTFADECIDMARASMRCHQEAMEMMDDQSLKIVYIHWTILYAPFIPFIVIFCLVIETSDDEDLRRLADFVKSLETACDVSSSVRKLHQLCQVLYNVAELYVEAKALEPVGPAGNEFDLYLSQLGFMPVDDTNMMGMQTDLNGAGGDVDPQMRSMAQAHQLEDWFSSKNYMMGLLEEDLSGINSTEWPS